MTNINPTLARQLTDNLSVGVGLDYYKSRAILRSEVNYGGGALGEFDLDADGDGWGYNLGLQWQYSEDLSLGITCRSEVTIDYEGDVQRDDVPAWVPGAPNASNDAETTIRFPWSIAVGACWQATPKLRLEAALEWMDWSRWDERTVDTRDPALGTYTVPLDWDDSWILMLGGEYVLNDRWTMRAGYSFNETPVPDRTADTTLPNGDVHVLALGLGWEASEAMTLDLGFNLAYGEKRTLDNSGAPRGGSFDALSTYLSFGVRYRF